MTPSARKFLQNTIFAAPTESGFKLFDIVMTPHGVGEICGFSSMVIDGNLAFTFSVDLYYDGRTKDNRIITTKKFELEWNRKDYHQKLIQKL